MKESLQLQLVAVLVLFLASLVGVNIPLLFITKELEYLLPLINAMSAGVMLGLAMVISRDMLFSLVLTFVLSLDTPYARCRRNVKKSSSELSTQ
jgi:hypothetical protein